MFSALGKRYAAGLDWKTTYAFDLHTEPQSKFCLQCIFQVHRPHTRRKRENDLASYQRLFQVRANLEKARQLLAMVQKRERRKKELLDASQEAIDMRVRHKFDPRAREEDDARLAAEDAERERREAKRRKEEKARARAEAAHMAALALREGELGIQNGSAMDVDLQDIGVGLTADGKRPIKKGKKGTSGKRKSKGLPSQQQMAKLTAALEPCMLFAQPLDPKSHIASTGVASSLYNAFPPAYTNSRCRARVGRGGRIVFDRCASIAYRHDPFTASTSNGSVTDPNDISYKTFEVNTFTPSTSANPLAATLDPAKGGDSTVGTKDGSNAPSASAALALEPQAANAAQNLGTKQAATGASAPGAGTEVANATAIATK